MTIVLSIFLFLVILFGYFHLDQYINIEIRDYLLEDLGFLLIAINQIVMFLLIYITRIIVGIRYNQQLESIYWNLKVFKNYLSEKKILIDCDKIKLSVTLSEYENKIDNNLIFIQLMRRLSYQKYQKYLKGVNKDRIEKSAKKKLENRFENLMEFIDSGLDYFETNQDEMYMKFMGFVKCDMGLVWTVIILLSTVVINLISLAIDS